MDPSPLELLLLVGLTARTIRLAVVDDIAEPARVRTVQAAGALGDRPAAWTAALLGCPFCVGFWISCAVAGAWILAGHTLAYQAVAIAGTLSYVAGHLVASLDLTDEEYDRG